MSEKENNDQQSKQIELPEIIQFPISMIKLDPDNPNVMSEEKLANLRYVMSLKGFLQPIIIDQNGMICDGQHRFQVYKETDNTHIPVYQLTLNDDERRLLQQAMNKIHGEHDLEKDITILSDLRERLPDLVWNMLSVNEGSIDDMRQQLIEQNKELQKLNKDNSEEESTEPKEIGEELEVDHQCPRCGYGIICDNK